MAEEVIASPLSLLQEEESAEEILFLGFSVNLGFWEKVGLSIARSLRARVTIVGDAHFVTADPRSVRNSGRTYLDGRAVCRQGGAFHPKLMVAVGEDRATVAIGSGNITLAGWGDNAEVWSVFRTSDDLISQAAYQVGVWLKQMRKHIRVGPGVAAAFDRVANGLSGFTPVEDGPSLVSSARASILSQLPKGPVDRLIVCAPFVDPKAAALSALAERLQPRKLEILVQSELGDFDGPSLERVAKNWDGRISDIASERYHHGKLIEWSIGGEVGSLTGSPNLSRSALCLPMIEGGNCELGLLQTGHASLAPKVGAVVSSERLRTKRVSSKAPLAGPVLLAVQWEGEYFRVFLARALDVDGELQMLDEADVWRAIAVLPSGLSEIVVACPEGAEAGRAIRISAGELQSPAAFVQDPSRILRRLISGGSRARASEDDVFSDPKIAEAFLVDLHRLRAFLADSHVGAPSMKVVAGARPESGGAFKGWEDYLDSIEMYVGEAMLRYGLGLPRISAGSHGAFEEDFDDDDFSEDGDEVESGVRVTSTIPDFSSRKEKEKARYRRWCATLAAESSHLPPLGQIIVLRLLLRAVAGLLWPSPTDWVPVVARATCNLGAIKDLNDNERSRVASIAAVGVAALKTRARLAFAHGPLEIAYTSTVNVVRNLMSDATPDLIDKYVAELRSSANVGLTPDLVMATVLAISRRDPIDSALPLVEELGFVVERDGDVLTIVDEVKGDPRRATLRLIGLLLEAPIVGVVGRGRSYSVIAAWRHPWLVLVRRWPTTRDTRTYKFEDVGYLAAVTKTEADFTHREAKGQTDLAAEILQALKVSL